MSALIQTDHVRVEFGPIVAVDDVSFELTGGSLLGLIGPNGAGKTTLLRVLAGLQTPTRGTATIFGHPVLGEYEEVRHQIGFAPDAPPAYEDLTIDQFLRFIAGAYRFRPAETDERIDFWLEQLWLGDKRYSKIKELSRGMRQRVTLARTFLPQPHVMLLDEPLAGLDPAGRIQLRRVLASLRDQGCAMIVSSHILSDLEEVSTHIAIIEQGRILKWAHADAIHDGHETARTFRLTTVDANADYTEAIARVDGVGAIVRAGRVYTFEANAQGEEIVRLLRSLLDADLPVVGFEQTKASLEDAYLRAGVKQVD